MSADEPRGAVLTDVPAKELWIAPEVRSLESPDINEGGLPGFPEGVPTPTEGQTVGDDS